MDSGLGQTIELPAYSLRASAGVTPLTAAIGILSLGQIADLKALSIGSVEELFGLIGSDPKTLSTYLRVPSLVELQADLAPRSSQFLDLVAARPVPPKALGALPPPEVELFAEAPDFRHDKDATRPPTAFPVPRVGPPKLLPGVMNAIRSQGQRGTCVAFAVTAALEYTLRESLGTPIDLSEQFLYWAAKQADGAPDRPGTLIKVAVGCLAATGQALEELWPYNPTPMAGNESQRPAPGDAIQDASNRKADGALLDARNVSAIVAEVDAGRPVPLTVPVYPNWIDNDALDEYGFFPLPLATSRIKGGHAMCVVGYGADADTPGGGYFVMRNSWSDQWALQSPVGPGLGILPFAYVERLAWEACALGRPT